MQRELFSTSGKQNLTGALGRRQTNSFCGGVSVSGLLYKRRSQEKTVLYRPEFFSLRSPLD
jgi:hypothetical protein